MLTKILFVLLIVSSFSELDWTKVDDIIIQAIHERAFPGASLAVANQTHVLYRKNYGYLTYTNQIHDVQVTNQTQYDTASISKIMSTVFAIMKLVGNNQLSLTDLVSKYYPDYDCNNKGNTTIGNLLQHNSGLPLDYPGPFPTTFDQVINYIVFVKPDFPVGTKFQPSNLAFILLGKIVEKVSQKQFQAYFEQNKVIMGLKNSNFNPPPQTWYNIAPTDYDGVIRKRIVRGQVSEKLCYSLGGVTGHNGIFTDGDDVIRYLMILLGKGRLPEDQRTRILPEDVVDLFTTRVEGLPFNNVFGQGFDTSCYSPRMKRCFGYLGKTGLMTQADKQTKIAFVLMNNRLHPDVNNLKLIQYIRSISEAIMETLGF